MPAEADGALLLTGATGFIGGEVLLRVLERTDRQVVVPVRGDARARTAEVLRRLGAEHHAARVHPIGAASRWPRSADITTVVHTAADVRFDRPLEAARAANVDGARRVLEQAAHCPGLQRVVHVSTAFVQDAPRNTYEQSKAEAEAVVRASGLPWQVVRPSIVVGDSRTGWTTSFNVIYLPLRAFARGLLTEVPGNPAAPVDVVPVDHVADALLALATEPPGRTHAVVAGARATTVGELATAVARVLDRPAPRSASGPGSLDLGELTPYFAVGRPFADPATEALLRAHGLEAPPLEAYLAKLLAFAARTGWGRRLPARRPPVVPAAAAR